MSHETGLKIASWNVNSLKVRLPQVVDWMQAQAIDVLALQETKLVDEQFPLQAFQDLGYHVSYNGQKTYNGVAIISQQPLSEICHDNPYFTDPARRFLAVTVKGIRIVNVYVPNGQELMSEKYSYKLDFLDALRTFLKEELQRYPALMVMGDFNIAPEDQDVHDPAAWEGSVLVSEAVRAAFHQLLELGLVDGLRQVNPNDDALYSWWDYRQAAFRRNHGLRIDHILLSHALATQCQAGGVDSIPRKHERPSDHAPVWVKLV